MTRPARDMVVLFGAAVVVALALVILPRISTGAPFSPSPEWRTEAPPDMEPIIGLWYSGDIPRSHVVVMLRGEAFEYGLADAPVQKLEDSAPVIWWGLP